MACGLPVVATDVPGTRDILASGEGGILVPADDVKATVAACQNLLANKTLRRQLGQKGRQESVLKYDEHAWGNKILDFYQKVFASLRVEKVRKMKLPFANTFSNHVTAERETNSLWL